MNEISFDLKIEQLKNDNISGSAELVERALLILKEEINENKNLWSSYSLNEILANLHKIIDINQEMVAFRNLTVDFLEQLKQGKEIEVIPSFLIQQRKEKNGKLTQNVAAKLFEAKRIITISRSSTIVKALAVGKRRKNLPELLILESRPNLEGQKLAKECLNLGFRVKYGVDMTARVMIERYQPDLAIIGADTIFPNGDVLNKIGSHTLALLSREYNVPFVVATSTSKIMLKSITIQKRTYTPQEVWNESIPESLEVINEYFERVKHNYITAYITEKGLNEKIPKIETSLSNELIEKIYDA
ncbi:MAG: hypothetical protein ACTSQE_05820 [Candidatus Heimdallarchaeaceae archaeon]